MSEALRTRIESVLRRIEKAAIAAGRSPSDVTLVAVGKTFPANTIAAAHELGLTDFGENRAQELRQKRGQLPDTIRWHFVGHLQTNKVRDVVGNVRLIHSIDSIDLAEAVARRARALSIEQDVLVQVNIAGEPTKHGVPPQELAGFVHACRASDGLRVVGLMTIPPLADQPEASRPHFRRMRGLLADVASAWPGTELSMGMTSDLEVAVEEGATYVRVGEGVFGPRRSTR